MQIQPPPVWKEIKNAECKVESTAFPPFLPNCAGCYDENLSMPNYFIPGFESKKKKTMEETSVATCKKEYNLIFNINK